MTVAAVRQINYCTHCGIPLVGSQSGPPWGPTYFCRCCGHSLSSKAGSKLSSEPSSKPISKPSGPSAPVLVPNLAQRAGAWRRGAAGVVDIVLAVAAGLLAWGLAADASVILSGGHVRGAPTTSSLLAWVAGATVLACYQPFFWWRYGQTPGMQLFGVRLTRTDGSPMTLLRAIARQLAMVLSALPLGLGFVLAARDARGRAWHDRLAGTVTVNRPPRHDRTLRLPVNPVLGRSAWDPKTRTWNQR